MKAFLPARITLPAKISYRQSMGPIRNQGGEGLCAGFAAAAMKSFQELAEWLTLFEFSPRQIFQEAKYIDGYPDEPGTTLRAVMSVLESIGACLESSWPYIPNKPGKGVSDWAGEASLYRIRGYARLGTIEEIMESIMINGPCCVGMEVTSVWTDVPEDGIMRDPRSNARKLGGHAVCVCGFDRIEERLLIRNSWGTAWGSKGYSWISFQHVQEYLISAWSASDLITSV